MQTYEQLLEENRELRAQLAERDARIAELEALPAGALSRISALEAQLKTNSRNSSKPPSSDPPNVAAHEKQKRKKGGGKRSRGGQLCWAHLLRDFERIAEFGAESARIGKDLLSETKRMFTWWHELKAGGLSRSGFQERMGPVMTRVEELLAKGAAGSHKKSAGKCREIRKLRAALWTFVTHENIEPTNNAAERALRPAVIWRRLSFGSASDRGSRFVERMLTVTATCRQQGRNVLEYLVAACEAHARGEPAPSLLPQAAEVRLVKRGG